MHRHATYRHDHTPSVTPRHAISQTVVPTNTAVPETRGERDTDTRTGNALRSNHQASEHGTTYAHGRQAHPDDGHARLAQALVHGGLVQSDVGHSPTELEQDLSQDRGPMQPIEPSPGTTEPR